MGGGPWVGDKEQRQVGAWVCDWHVLSPYVSPALKAPGLPRLPPRPAGVLGLQQLSASEERGLHFKCVPGSACEAARCTPQSHPVGLSVPLSHLKACHVRVLKFHERQQPVVLFEVPLALEVLGGSDWNCADSTPRLAAVSPVESTGPSAPRLSVLQRECGQELARPLVASPWVQILSWLLAVQDRGPFSGRTK